ncbi:MAG: hypothetical protein ACYCQI_16010 [Gammaproteobacteria bacterium]
MRTRLYVLTHEVSLGYTDSKDQNGPTSYHDRTQEELKESAIHAANLLSSRSTLHAFTRLKDAKKYVKESRTYRLIQDDLDEYDYYPRGERAIVEIFVDSTIKSQWQLKSEKAGDRKEYIHHIKYPQHPDKFHHFYEIPNRPEMYVTYRIWINLKEYALHNQPPKSYKKIMSKHTDEINNVIDLFHDYHSPKLFSCHWRHHKKTAIRITNQLAQFTRLQEVYDFLFKERQQLIQTNKNLNISGSFMRRMDYALKKIRDVAGGALEEKQDQWLDLKKSKISVS